MIPMIGALMLAGSTVAWAPDQREAQASLDIETWIVRTDLDYGSDPDPIQVCPDPQRSVVLSAKTVDLSHKKTQVVYCVRVHSKYPATPWADVLPFVAEVEARDSEGTWQLVRSSPSEDSVITTHAGVWEAWAALPVDIARMEAFNVHASTVIGAPRLPCDGEVRLSVRQRGGGPASVAGKLAQDHRRYHARLTQCSGRPGRTNPEPAEPLRSDQNDF